MNGLHSAEPAGRLPTPRRLAAGSVVMLVLAGIVRATGAAEDP